MFKVEKNVPMPASEWQRGCPPKYPFGSMSIGDSFLVPSGEKNSKLHARVSSAATAYSKLHAGYKFTVRQADGGYRVWRVPTTPKLVAAE